MGAQTRSLLCRLAAFAAASAALWVAAVGMLTWYLPRMVAEEYRTGARVSTDGDSISIPLFTFAILFAAVLIAANIIAAALLLWRQRGQRGLAR